MMVHLKSSLRIGMLPSALLIICFGLHTQWKPDQSAHASVGLMLMPASAVQPCTVELQA